MQNKFGVGETVFRFDEYKIEIMEYEVTGMERDEEGTIRYKVENHHGIGSTPIKGENLTASREECLKNASDYLTNNFKENILKLFAGKTKKTTKRGEGVSKEFEGLKQLIQISNEKLILDILLPQICALEDEEEKRKLMTIIRQKENELDTD